MKSKINLILLTIIFSIILVGSASAVYDDWDYKKPVNVTENSGSNLADYQVLLTVDTASLISAGKMQADCDDIRLADSDETTELSYWVESGCNTASTKVWVKTNLSANSNTTVYLYYGDSGASSMSNGTNTFEFFDDFEGSSLDTAKWTEYRNAAETTAGTYTSQSDGILTIDASPADNSASIVSIATNLPSTAVVTYKAKQAEQTYPYSIFAYGNGAIAVVRGYNHHGLRFYNDYFLYNTYNTFCKYVDGTISQIDGTPNLATDWDNYHVYSIILKPADTEVLRDDQSYFTGEGSNILTGTQQLLISGCYASNGGGNLYVDYVYIREYASPEPTTTIGSEQQNAGETQPTYSNFTGSETTDFSTSDVANVTNLTLAVTGKGKINFPPTHSVNAYGEDYNTHVKIENSLIFVNSSALDNTFNNSATLTFEEVNCNAPYVYYSDTASTRVTIIEENNLCFPPRCANIQCTGSTLTIDVTHFSGYAVNGTANLTIDADDPKYPLELVTFTAEYLNSTGFITDATCNISFTDGSHIMDEQADHYNYTRTFASVQIVEYNVTCNKSGESTVFANDTAVIQSIDIPEFSTITLGLGLIAVLAGLIVIRKK